MDIEAVDPALREATRRLRVPDIRRPLIRRAVRLATGLLRTHRVEGVETSTVRDGAVRLRLHRPLGTPTDAALLWVHGGGYAIGAAVQDDRLCAGTAARLGITIVAAEYRLAPEHPFPEPLDDIEAVWRWLHVHAEGLGIDPARIAIGGESAGAGLAAALVQRLHDDPSAARPAAQWLFAPMIDDRTAARTELDGLDHRVWSNRVNHAGWRYYLGVEPGSPALPAYAAAARREHLDGLAPAWIGVGDIELFHDEDVAYATRLRDSGVEAALDVVPGAPHGFENWAPDTAPARGLVDRAQRWLAGALQIPLPAQAPEPTREEHP